MAKTHLEQIRDILWDMYQGMSPSPGPGPTPDPGADIDHVNNLVDDIEDKMGDQNG